MAVNRSNQKGKHTRCEKSRLIETRHKMQSCTFIRHTYTCCVCHNSQLSCTSANCHSHNRTSGSVIFNLGKELHHFEWVSRCCISSVCINLFLYHNGDKTLLHMGSVGEKLHLKVMQYNVKYLPNSPINGMIIITGP